MRTVRETLYWLVGCAVLLFMLSACGQGDSSSGTVVIGENGDVVVIDDDGDIIVTGQTQLPNPVQQIAPIQPVAVGPTCPLLDQNGKIICSCSSQAEGEC